MTSAPSPLLRLLPLLLLVPALVIIWLQRPDAADWRLQLASQGNADRGETPVFRSDFASAATDLFVHAASVTELADGRLLTVWFGGSREGASDVNIYGAYFDPATQQWDENQVLASRSSTHEATGRTIRKLGNPVVSQAPGRWLGRQRHQCELFHRRRRQLDCTGSLDHQPVRQYQHPGKSRSGVLPGWQHGLAGLP
jgi:hypothetical protein